MIRFPLVGLLTGLAAGVATLGAIALLDEPGRAGQLAPFILGLLSLTGLVGGLIGGLIGGCLSGLGNRR